MKTVAAGSAFEIRQESGRTVLRRRRSLGPIVMPLVMIAIVTGPLLHAGGVALAFVPLLPALVLMIAVTMRANSLAGRGFYHRVRRELVVERAEAASYRDDAAPRVLVDGRALAAAVRDVVVRTTPFQQAFQVYGLLADGGVVHVAGTREVEEARALRSALLDAVGLPPDPNAPRFDVVGWLALLVLLPLAVAACVGIVLAGTYGSVVAREDLAEGVATSALGVLAVVVLFATAVATLVRPGMRRWVRAQHSA